MREAVHVSVPFTLNDNGSALNLNFLFHRYLQPQLTLLVNEFELKEK